MLIFDWLADSVVSKSGKTNKSIKNNFLENKSNSSRSPDLSDISQYRQKMKFSIYDFFSKCDQIRKNLRVWSHLLKKSLMENCIFCAVQYSQNKNSSISEVHFRNLKIYLL